MPLKVRAKEAFACVSVCLILPAVLLLYYRPDNKPSSTFLTKEHIYWKRRIRASDYCVSQSPGRVDRVVYDHEWRMAMCVIPKIGCTFWINIFRYLNNATGNFIYESPFDIPRYLTHFGPSMSTAQVLTDKPGPKNLSRALRFMFVRCPYERLWSAWIDKFWLVDFWNTKLIPKWVNETGQGPLEKCAGNVTFVQFLTYITENDPEDLNEHWVPYRYKCDACQFRPHIIGKMETFSQDTRSVLETVNLNWLTDSGTQRISDHSLNEMSMLTKYNVFLYPDVSDEGSCCTPAEFYQRLWTAYQYNGHLPANRKFPIEQFNTKNADSKEDAFIKLCKETYLSWTDRHTHKNKQKRDALVEGYKDVPLTVMKKLQDIYRLDFEMYDYEKEPKDLYRGKKEVCCIDC